MRSLDFMILSTILFFNFKLCLKSHHVLTIVLYFGRLTYHPWPLTQELFCGLMDFLSIWSMNLLKLHTFCAHVYFSWKTKGLHSF